MNSKEATFISLNRVNEHAVRSQSIVYGLIPATLLFYFHVLYVTYTEVNTKTLQCRFCTSQDR